MSSRVCHTRVGTAPDTSVHPPSSVWAAMSCSAVVPGGAVGVRQNRRCCHTVPGRSVAHAAVVVPCSTGAP